ncbi:hypothetical protein Pcinc_025970 [Petrolisthes cinctipes]|uniref:Uncharacterized protein n=1 Tax=Petrolisthes cinctipes TaxID=88211 RepID=A0AAE1KCA1_PETCI|nr:hypothetical protein Pcinc_025970 [Petrolisthes cinctipes]
MRLPWGVVDWPLIGRRKSEGVSDGEDWVRREEGGRANNNNVNSSYTTSTHHHQNLSGRYLTQAEQFARSVIYATILRSKAKISAARYRLVQSMAEEEGEGDGFQDDHDTFQFDENEVDDNVGGGSGEGGWRLPSSFLKLSRKRSVKLGLKSFRRSFKQPLAELILGGKKWKCELEPSQSPLIPSEESFESLCEEVLQKTYELVTPLDKTGVKVEELLIPGQDMEMEILHETNSLIDMKMRMMQGAMSTEEEKLSLDVTGVENMMVARTPELGFEVTGVENMMVAKIPELGLEVTGVENMMVAKTPELGLEVTGVENMIVAKTPELGLEVTGVENMMVAKIPELGLEVTGVENMMVTDETPVRESLVPLVDLMDLDPPTHDQQHQMKLKREHPKLGLKEAGDGSYEEEMKQTVTPSVYVPVKPPPSSGTSNPGPGWWWCEGPTNEKEVTLTSALLPPPTTITTITTITTTTIPASNNEEEIICPTETTVQLEPLSILTLPRSPKRWKLPSFDDPTPVLEPNKVLEGDVTMAQTEVNEADTSTKLPDIKLELNYKLSLDNLTEVQTQMDTSLSTTFKFKLDDNEYITTNWKKNENSIISSMEKKAEDSSEEAWNKKRVLEKNLKNLALNRDCPNNVDTPLTLNMKEEIWWPYGLSQDESNHFHILNMSRCQKRRSAVDVTSFRFFQRSPKKVKLERSVDPLLEPPAIHISLSGKNLNIEPGINSSSLNVVHQPTRTIKLINSNDMDTDSTVSLYLRPRLVPSKRSGETGMFWPHLPSPPTKRRKESCVSLTGQAGVVATVEEACGNFTSQAGMVATLEKACGNFTSQAGMVATLEKACGNFTSQAGMVATLEKACGSLTGQAGMVATLEEACGSLTGQAGMVATLEEACGSLTGQAGMVATLEEACGSLTGQAGMVATLEEACGSLTGQAGMVATLEEACGSLTGQAGMLTTLKESYGSFASQAGMVATLNEECGSPVEYVRHLDAFEFYRAEDEREWARRYEEVHVDTKSASAMFKLLQAKLQYSAAYPHFLSLLHHLLLLPSEVAAPDAWILYDRVVQQLVTQRPDGEDREVQLLDINVSEIVKLIASERELTESRRKISKLEADFADVVTDLNSKEQQLYAVTQEKEDLTQTLSQVRAQLEAEVRSGQEGSQRVSHLEARVEELTTQLREVAKGCVSDDVKATIAKDASDSSKGAPPPPPPPPMMNGIPPPPPPMMNGGPPPPPPMMNGGPPPPPPMMQGGPPPPPMMNGGPPLPSQNKQNRPSKQVPRSANQLRAFNWSKMPEGRVGGTIFDKLDESCLYKFMDLEDIDRTFDASAGRKTGGEGEKTLERIKSQKMHQISFLENRRQQNCTILLSKLKMTNEELVKVLLKMDSDGELAPDMVEQLLKFTPTVEEKTMLEEHQDEMDTLARADRFLFQISKIEHYEERLRCLLYQKKYRERLGECEPRMTAVSMATRELTNSKRLKKLIEIVLAFGNYMNKGARGGAYGFRMSSLNKLTDVKASSNRSITLLHYILRVSEKQWRDVLRLDDDFPSLKEAAKVNITELEKEMCGLREGLSFIEREVAWHRGQGSPPPGDRFRLAMNEFSALARDKFTNLEAQFTLMKSQFEGVTKLFGEDSKTTQPEDFFGTFDSFIDTFRDVKKDLENMRKKEEEEERKKKEAERREVERERRAKERSIRQQAGGAGGAGTGAGGAGGGAGGDSSSGGENENDFDDLISALRSGDVFGKDIDKMRRKKKQSFSGGARESTRERVTGSHKYA